MANKSSNRQHLHINLKPKEIEEDWLEEVHRRVKELDEGVVQPIPAEEVRRKAQALLR